MGLHGKTVLITRASDQSAGLRTLLESSGARVLDCPAIEIVPIADWTEIDAAIRRLPSYDWLLLTSANAAGLFFQRAEAIGELAAARSAIVAVVGSATAESLAKWNVKAALVPETYRAEGLLESLPASLEGKRILFPRAESAREILPEGLRARGAAVDIVPVYRTVRSEKNLETLGAILAAEVIDCVAFTSPSAIRFFSEALKPEIRARLEHAAFAVIGPVAREAAEREGMRPAIEPVRATIPALVEAIEEYFDRIAG